MVPRVCSSLGVLLSLLVICLSWLVARHYSSRLPAPVDSQSSSRFVARNAQKYVERMTHYGPRPVGSYECDVQTVAYLQSVLDTMASESRQSQARVRMEVDTQVVSGTFHLRGYDLYQKYEDVTNVVVRLSNSSQQAGVRPAILVNCHFDSVPMGPGASDDAVSCGVMLEIIRVMLTSPRTILSNDLIFLFNGAEEVILTGSHGFITQHKWADSIRAFINLEAAGSGGRELLFQSGPGNPWLVKSYIKSAPHPFGSIIGEEIFQSGIIPSDTDFRVFRDHGRVPGLDIAFIDRGEVYHTEHDTAARIPGGSVQRAGDNVLAVLNRLTRLKNLEEVSLDNKDSEGGTAVYFDFLGIVMISYPAWLGVIITVAMVILLIFSLQQDLRRFEKKHDVKPRDSMKTMASILISILLILVTSVVTNATIGAILGLLSCEMSWYSRPYFLFLLYSLPTVYCALLIFSALRAKVTKISDEMLEQLTFHSVNIILAALASVCTVFGLNSSFIFSNTLMFPLAWWFIVKILKSDFSNWKSFLLLNFLVSVPLSQWSYMVQLIFTIFVPIMGRRGMVGNPDIIMGVVTALFTVILMLLIFPVLVTIRRQTLLRWLTVTMFCVAISLVTLTSYGFPYSGDARWPAPKRLSVYNVARSLETGEQDGGLLVCRQDHFSLASLDHIPEYNRGEAVTPAQCEERLGCGLPSPSLRSVTGSEVCVWVPGDPPRPVTETRLDIVSLQRLGGDVTNVTLRLEGPSRVMVHVSSLGGSRVEGWSLGDQGLGHQAWSGAPVWTGQLISGHGHSGSHQVWVSVRGGARAEGAGLGLVVSLSGHHTAGVQRYSPELRTFIDKHPAWVSLGAWTVDYKYYIL